MDILLDIYNIHSYYDLIYQISLNLNYNIILLDKTITLQLIYCTLKKYKSQYIYNNDLFECLQFIFIDKNKIINNKGINDFLNIIMNYDIPFYELFNYINMNNNLNNINELININIKN